MGRKTNEKFKLSFNSFIHEKTYIPHIKIYGHSYTGTLIFLNGNRSKQLAMWVQHST